VADILAIGFFLASSIHRLRTPAVEATDRWGIGDMTKSRPWRIGLGGIVGFAIALVIWWSAYDPARGLLQHPQLLIAPVAAGIFIVTLRNRHKKVGPFDPDVRARSESGQV
jgi:hypothetical protein